MHLSDLLFDVSASSVFLKYTFKIGRLEVRLEVCYTSLLNTIIFHKGAKKTEMKPNPFLFPLPNSQNLIGRKECCFWTNKGVDCRTCPTLKSWKALFVNEDVEFSVWSCS